MVLANCTSTACFQQSQWRFCSKGEEDRLKLSTAMREMRRIHEKIKILLAFTACSTAKILQLLRRQPRGCVDTVMMAGSWNLIDQTGYEVVLECQRQGISIHNAGVFASGLLLGGNTVRYATANTKTRALRDRWTGFAVSQGFSLGALALAFAWLPQCVSKVAYGIDVVWVCSLLLLPCCFCV